MPPSITLRVPPQLAVKIVKSKYPSLSPFFTTISLFIGIICLISLSFIIPSKYGSQRSRADLMFDLNTNIVCQYWLLAIIFAIISGYIGYIIERKFTYLGTLEISCETEDVLIKTNENTNTIPFKSINRFLYDINAIKSELSLYSISSVGAKNYIELELGSEKPNLKFEIVINSEEEADVIKQISFYHTSKYR